MDDLLTWLRAQLDALEAAAPSEHFVGSESQLHRCPAARDPEACGDLEYGEENCDCGLTQRRAYVLADVAAKRQIIDEHAPSADHFSDEAGEYDPRFPIRGRTHVCETCGQSNGEEWTGGFHPCGTLRLLALPFAGHPEYDESWRP